jgi:hypothetical protein
MDQMSAAVAAAVAAALGYQIDGLRTSMDARFEELSSRVATIELDASSRALLQHYQKSMEDYRQRLETLQLHNNHLHEVGLCLGSRV